MLHAYISCIIQCFYAANMKVRLCLILRHYDVHIGLYSTYHWLKIKRLNRLFLLFGLTYRLGFNIEQETSKLIYLIHDIRLGIICAIFRFRLSFNVLKAYIQYAEIYWLQSATINQIFVMNFPYINHQEIHFTSNDWWDLFTEIFKNDILESPF